MYLATLISSRQALSDYVCLAASPHIKMFFSWNTKIPYKIKFSNQSLFHGDSRYVKAATVHIRLQPAV